MAITVAKLHKLLGELIAEGAGRAPVAIDKATFRSNQEEDGGTIIDITQIDVQYVNMLDGDGFNKTNKDGSESLRRMAVITGGPRPEPVSA